jgi:DNA-binding transcriptional LysR family regulator
MNVKQIQYLIVIKDMGSVTKAADHLGLSQPQLSKFLKHFEKELGVKLFARLPRSLKITKEGEIYLKTFKAILELLKSAENEISILHNDYVEKISIGIHPLIGKFLVPLLERNLDDYRSIELKYVFKNSRDVVQEVLDGKIDLGIVADAKKYPDLIIKPLWKEHVGLYSKDGKKKNWVIFNSNMIFSQKILKKIQINKIRRIDDYNVIYSTLIASDLMGLLPAPIAEQEGKLKPIEMYNPPITISLIYRSDKRKTSSLSKIVNLIKMVSR